jgi:hypothetical protein
MKVFRLILILATLAALAAFAVPRPFTKVATVDRPAVSPQTAPAWLFSATATGSNNTDGQNRDNGSSRGRGGRGALDCYTSQLARDDSAGPIPPVTMANPWIIEHEGAIMRLTPNRPGNSPWDVSRSRGSDALDQGNDRCPATVIAAVPFRDTGTFKDLHSDFNTNCNYGGHPDIVYQFTPPQSARYILSLWGDVYSGAIDVKTGGSCPGTESVICRAASLHSSNRSLSIPLMLNAGQTYFFVVSADTNDGYSSYAFAVREALECQADFDLVAPGTVSGNTCMANDNCPLTVGDDQIVRVTLPRTARWTFGLCDLQPWDAQIYLTRDCCSDSFLTSAIYGCEYTMPGWLSRPVTRAMVLQAGDYYLRVEGANPGACGPWTLTVEETEICTSPPPNDDIANAGAPVVLPATLTGNNRCSTHDCSLLTYGHGETWHAIQVNETSDIAIDFCGSQNLAYAYYTVLISGSLCQSFIQASDYSYNGCDNYVPVAIFRGVPRGVYYLPVMWDSNSVDRGSYTVNVRSVPTCNVEMESGDVVECPEGAGIIQGIDCDGGCGTNRGFQAISIGQSVYGRMFSYVIPPSTYRRSDADWFEFTLDDTASISVTITAQFPISIGIYERECSYQYAAATGYTLLPCSTLTLTTGCLRPYTYAIGLSSAHYMLPLDTVHYRFTVTSTSCEWPVRIVEEPGDLPENEPVCQEGYHDQYNSGCDYSNVFQDIASGTTILGTSGVYRQGSYYSRDTDWYRVVTTTPSIIDVAVMAEFNPYIILSSECPGCDGGMVEVSGNAGDTVHATTWCVDPGTYYFGLFPTDGTSLECGSRYRMWLNCGPCAPCTDLAQPGDILENEVACSTYVDYADRFNGGCNSAPPVYGPTLRCGQAVAGRSGTGWAHDGTYRDTDWLLFNLAGTETPQFNVVAQFPVTAAIAGPGSGFACDSVVLFSEVASGNACDTLRISPTQPLNAGTYWLFVAPSVYRNIPCGSEYRAWVTCASCEPDTVQDLTIRRVGNDIVLRWSADPTFTGTYTIYHAMSYPANAAAWEIVTAGVAPQAGERRTSYTHTGVTQSEVNSQFYMVVGVCP